MKNLLCKGTLSTVAIALILVGGAAGSLRAQGTQLGELTGTVTSADHAALPGVTVTIKSAALLGVRTAVTDVEGGYILKSLPPGTYTVTYALSGMTTIEKSVRVLLGGAATENAMLSIANVEETVNVTAEAPSPLNTTEGGANLAKKDIDTLPTDRDLFGVTTLAPGLSENSPNGSQVTISGGFSYDNVFLIDGVDVDDNLFGSPNNVFIEDAIEETQVLTSGVSAEYGRFTGGVINAVTKRGGNNFSGSFRTGFSNPAWTLQTPFEKENKIDRKSTLNKVYEETLGGPIIKDRIWFFGAARQEGQNKQNTFPFTGIAHTDINSDKRYEGKLTGAITPNHTLQFTYTRDTLTNTSPSFDFSVDPKTINTSTNPNDLFVAKYTGTVRSNVFVEAQYSQQKFCFCSGGGSSPDPVLSPFFTLGITSPPSEHYNGPYFASNVDPEHRDNRQLTANISYFLSTKALGKHDLKLGYENFRGTDIGGNSQSASNFVYYADYANSGGAPTLDAQGNFQPLFVPGANFINIWLPTRGARIDVTTNSFYLNDKIVLDQHWSFNLGTRYERVRSAATGGIIGVDTDTIVPRLAASFDVKGDGKFKLDGTFAKYAGKYNTNQVGSNQKQGNPDLIQAVYAGPPGQGLGFAPGLDPTQYSFANAVLPTANIFFDPGLSSPVSREITLGAGAQLGANGYVKGAYVNRKTQNFIQNFITIDQGKVNVTTPATCAGCQGPFLLDKATFRNTDLPQRDYQAFELNASYRLTSRWSASAFWTHEFKYDGNYEGEAPNQPSIQSLIGQYPELYVPSRNFPTGHLLGFEGNRIRAFTTYDLGLGKVGSVSIGLLYRHDSPGTYSLIATSQQFSSVQLSRNPGYAVLPFPNQNIYFGDRGAFFYPNANNLVDVALTYAVPVFRSLKPYVKFDMRNLFNSQPLGAGPGCAATNSGCLNTAVTPDPNGPVDSNGLPLNYIKDPKFLQAVGNQSYPIPRTYSISLGFRF